MATSDAETGNMIPSRGNVELARLHPIISGNMYPTSTDKSRDGYYIQSILPRRQPFTTATNGLLRRLVSSHSSLAPLAVPDYRAQPLRPPSCAFCLSSLCSNVLTSLRLPPELAPPY